MSLQDTKRTFQSYAKLLPAIEKGGKLTNRYEDYSIEALADGYYNAVTTGNRNQTDIYLSALLLRFWYTIDKVYKRVKTADVDREEILSRIYQCISNACMDRAWVSNPNLNAQQVINQVIATRCAAAIMYESNLNKNTKLYTILDDPIDDENSSTVGDLIADSNSETEFDNITTRGIIQELISKNKVIEAIIADNIAFKDVFRHEKVTEEKVTETGDIVKQASYTSEFWPFKLVQELNSLDNDYVSYFSENYDIATDILKVAIDKIVSAKNPKLYKYISNSKLAIATCLNH